MLVAIGGAAQPAKPPTCTTAAFAAKQSSAFRGSFVKFSVRHTAGGLVAVGPVIRDV